MSEMLPAQVRGLISDVHRNVVLTWKPGLLKSKDFKRDAKFLRECPDQVVLMDLPRCGKAFDRSLAIGEEKSFAFDVVDGLSAPLPNRIFRYFLEGVRNEDPFAVRALRQTLVLLSKLEVNFSSSDEAFLDFIQRNDSLPRSIPRSQLIANAQSCAAILLWGIDWTDIVPRHGPGVVSTREKPWEKMGFKRIYKSVEKVYPFTDYMFLNYTHLCDRLQDLERVVEVDYPVAKLVAVPKDFRGPRLISAEPLETQWLQQGQARLMMERLESHPLSRGHVNFTSQEVNRRLALQSSIDNEFVTIDLKDASDRVSYELTRAILPPDAFKHLDATRSHATRLPTGLEVPLRMFAPMGSAVCFPIESIVFYSLVVAALQRHKYPKRYLTHSDLNEIRHAVFVYGDDLIVKSPFADLAITALEEVGLKVNLDKCCTGPRFRESCGMDAYKGTDVTPVRLKHYPDRRSPVTLASSCDYINRLNELGLVHCANSLLNWTEREFGTLPRSARDLPLTIRVATFAEAALWNHQHLKKRRNPGLQCYEHKVPVLTYSYAHTRLPCWSEAFRAILLNTQADPRGYPVPHRVRLTTRWRILS